MSKKEHKITGEYMGELNNWFVECDFMNPYILGRIIYTTDGGGVVSKTKKVIGCSPDKQNIVTGDGNYYSLGIPNRELVQGFRSFYDFNTDDPQSTRDFFQKLFVEPMPVIEFSNVPGASAPEPVTP